MLTEIDFLNNEINTLNLELQTLLMNPITDEMLSAIEEKILRLLALNNKHLQHELETPLKKIERLQQLLILLYKYVFHAALNFNDFPQEESHSIYAQLYNKIKEYFKIFQTLMLEIGDAKVEELLLNLAQNCYGTILNFQNGKIESQFSLALINLLYSQFYDYAQTLLQFSLHNEMFETQLKLASVLANGNFASNEAEILFGYLKEIFANPLVKNNENLRKVLDIATCCFEKNPKFAIKIYEQTILLCSTNELKNSLIMQFVEFLLTRSNTKNNLPYAIDQINIVFKINEEDFSFFPIECTAQLIMLFAKQKQLEIATYLFSKIAATAHSTTSPRTLINVLNFALEHGVESELIKLNSQALTKLVATMDQQNELYLVEDLESLMQDLQKAHFNNCAEELAIVLLKRYINNSYNLDSQKRWYPSQVAIAILTENIDTRMRKLRILTTTDWQKMELLMKILQKNFMYHTTTNGQIIKNILFKLLRFYSFIPYDFQKKCYELFKSRKLDEETLHEFSNIHNKIALFFTNDNNNEFNLKELGINLVIPESQNFPTITESKKRNTHENNLTTELNFIESENPASASGKKTKIAEPEMRKTDMKVFAFLPPTYGLGSKNNATVAMTVEFGNLQINVPNVATAEEKTDSTTKLLSALHSDRNNSQENFHQLTSSLQEMIISKDEESEDAENIIDRQNEDEGEDDVEGIPTTAPTL